MNNLEQKRVRKVLIRKHDEFRRLFLILATRIGLVVATFMLVANALIMGVTHPVTLLIGGFALLLVTLVRFAAGKPERLQRGCQILLTALTAIVLAVPLQMNEVYDLSGSFLFMPVTIMVAAFLFDIRAATVVFGIMVIYNLAFTAGWLQEALGLDTPFLHPHPWGATIDRTMACAAAWLVSIGFLRLKKQHEAIIEQQHKELSLQKTLNSLGTMANGIAHEINNPLAIAKGAHYVLRKLTKDHQDWEKWLESSEAALERVTAIVSAIEVFSGKFSSTMATRLEPRSFLEDAWQTFQKSHALADTSLKLSLASEGRILIRDAHLTIILQNLLNNAWEAARQIEHGQIELRTWATEQHYCLELSNSAKPVDAETLQKIFDPFFTTKDVGDGPGLGLTVVYGLVVNYGGLITADYRDSRFVVNLSLPLYEALEAAA